MKTILLVEDEISLLCSFRIILEAEGYAVLTALDGEEAFKSLKEAKPAPDLVISDIMMPKVNGLELLLAIRDTPNFKKLPVIITSSATILPNVVKLWNQFLPKPVSETVLLAAVIKEIGPA